MFPFLRLNIKPEALISLSAIEKLALFKGLFKAKMVERFKHENLKKVSDIEIDQLCFFLDSVNESAFETSLKKETWQKLLFALRDQPEPELTYSLYSQEIRRILSISQISYE
jgi:hypothetical protein